jgi:hypothetical protein
MAIVITLPLGLSLKMDDTSSAKNGYPTAVLQKGLLLFDNGRELTEEAVGFGFPVLKKGLQTIFPGAVSVSYEQNDSTCKIIALYKMNLVEIISKKGSENLKSGLLYTIKNVLAAAIRHLPLVRGLLTNTSSRLRKIFNWETTYGHAGFETEVKVIYSVERETGKVNIEMDTSDLPSGITEVVVMNEQGASYFDMYQDASGISLHGEEIGCWDNVNAVEASFESSSHHVAFTLGKVKGAQLFRGRELIDERLDWAGFGYSYPPSIKTFQYAMKIERIQ